MRVIGGRLKGRRLFAPADLEIRPTIARLKECYFNIVRDRIEGARFLDLCAGSGAMGLEALSRGAREVVFVDSGKQAVALIQKNLASCGVVEGFSLQAGDLYKELPRLALDKRPFDLIYFDPPYFKGIYEKTLALLDRFSLLAPDGLLTANRFKKVVLPERVGRLALSREVRQGDSVLAFYTREAAPEPLYPPPEAKAVLSE